MAGRESKTGTPGVYPRRTANGVVYWLNYKGPSGRVFERAGTNARAAAKMLAERKAAVLRGDWRPLDEARDLGADGLLTVEGYAKRWHAARADAGVKIAVDEWQRLRDYVFPHIGDRALSDVTRADVVELMRKVATATRKKNPQHKTAPTTKLAPRTVHRVYEALRQMYADATREKLVDDNPCTLRVARGKRQGELPKKAEVDREWRKNAIFDVDEIEALISDERIPPRRRVFYALMLLTGMRLGEAAGRRWRDYDTKRQPLGCLTVHTQHNDEALKTDAPRLVPVHPTLATILDDWRRRGFVELHGRHPQPDDWIVPKVRGVGPQENAIVWKSLQHDLERLGLRPRRVHDMRRSFITQAMSAGARQRSLKAVTHDGKGTDIFDQYDEVQWSDMCTAVACLPVTRRDFAKVVQLKAAQGQ